MESILNDTHKIVDFLQTKGYSKEQAEGFVEAVKEFDTSALATTHDVEVTKQTLRNELMNVKSQLIMWFVGLEVATTGLLLSIILQQ